MQQIDVPPQHQDPSNDEAWSRLRDDFVITFNVISAFVMLLHTGNIMAAVYEDITPELPDDGLLMTLCIAGTIWSIGFYAMSVRMICLLAGIKLSLTFDMIASVGSLFAFLTAFYFYALTINATVEGNADAMIHLISTGAALWSFIFTAQTPPYELSDNFFLPRR